MYKNEGLPSIKFGIEIVYFDVDVIKRLTKPQISKLSLICYFTLTKLLK